ncbi:queuosine precursor transporter [Alphaproteobacteria bacterium]|nr:queuosine precursor transporter [Alphaproteobacteria bacterium]
MNENSAKIYSLLMAVFCVMLVLTNIIGTKIFVLFGETLPNGFFGFPLALTAGIITYPITFLVTDITSEIFGKQKANLLVIYGFICSLLSLIIISIVIRLVPSEAWLGGSPYSSLEDMNQAFNAVFSLPGILITASMTAYLVAQLIDIKIFHYVKKITNSKYLWLRNNISTMFSQLIDTIIVNSIFLGFGMKLDISLVIQIIICNYIIKIIFAMIDTPLVYLSVSIIRKNFLINKL